jgi:transcription elongation factor GreA
MTADGKTALEAELKQLLEVDEPNTVARVGEAAAEGDLRENFAYHDARRELGMIRGRIGEIKETLMRAVVVAAPVKTGIVQMGSVVVVREKGTDDDEEYAIVSAAESGKPRPDGKTTLSATSPIGMALMGKKAGQEVVAHTPSGDIIFKVMKVD